VTLARDFRRFEPGSARVFLVEAGPRILPLFPAGLGQRAAATRARMGVVTRTGAPVTAIDERGIELAGEGVRAGTVRWAAGVRASPPQAVPRRAPRSRGPRAGRARSLPARRGADAAPVRLSELSVPGTIPFYERTSPR